MSEFENAQDPCCFASLSLHCTQLTWISPLTQALEHVHHSATIQLPMHDGAQRAVLQEQLTLLAEIAQGVCGYSS